MAAPSSTAAHRHRGPRRDRVMFSAGSFWAFWPKRWMPFPPPPLPFGCMVPRPPVLERAFWRRICPTCCRLCCANWSKPLHEYLAADSQPSFSGRRRQHTCVYPDDPRAARAPRAGARPAERHWAKDLIESFGLPAPSPALVTMHQDGKESAAALFAAMSSAVSRLDICTYILGDDEFGRETMQRMIERARSGVEVRLLLDGVGAIQLPKACFGALQRGGVENANFSD